MDKKQLTWDNVDSLLLQPKEVLNVKELAALTKLSVSCIYHLCQQRKIPHSRPTGKILRFDRSKILQWLLSNEVPIIEDIEQEAINYVANKPWKGGNYEPTA
jgi:excisionase family DNA binding protein